MRTVKTKVKTISPQLAEARAIDCWAWICEECEDATKEHRAQRPDRCPCGSPNWRGRIRVYAGAPRRGAA
jgi:hypothetical protein